MTAIQLLACAGMIVGVFLLLGMKPVELTDSLFGFLLNPKRSLREDIRESSGRKKSGILRRELEEAQNILQMTGREMCIRDRLESVQTAYGMITRNEDFLIQAQQNTEQGMKMQ